MKSASCKAKGRALQNAVALIVRAAFALPPEDVRPAVMGETGVDIKLSARARAVFPFAVECKKRESLNVWEALKQAEANAKKEGLRPLLVFQRNRSQAYVALSLADFMDLADTDVRWRALLAEENGQTLEDAEA